MSMETKQSVSVLEEVATVPGACAGVDSASTPNSEGSGTTPSPASVASPDSPSPQESPGAHGAATPEPEFPLKLHLSQKRVKETLQLLATEAAKVYRSRARRLSAAKDALAWALGFTVIFLSFGWTSRHADTATMVPISLLGVAAAGAAAVLIFILRRARAARFGTHNTDDQIRRQFFDFLNRQHSLEGVDWNDVDYQTYPAELENICSHLSGIDHMQGFGPRRSTAWLILLMVILLGTLCITYSLWLISSSDPTRLLRLMAQPASGGPSLLQWAQGNRNAADAAIRDQVFLSMFLLISGLSCLSSTVFAVLPLSENSSLRIGMFAVITILLSSLAYQGFWDTANRTLPPSWIPASPQMPPIPTQHSMSRAVKTVHSSPPPVSDVIAISNAFVWFLGGERGGDWQGFFNETRSFGPVEASYAFSLREQDLLGAISLLPQIKRRLASRTEKSLTEETYSQATSRELDSFIDAHANELSRIPQAAYFLGEFAHYLATEGAAEEIENRHRLNEVNVQRDKNQTATVVGKIDAIVLRLRANWPPESLKDLKFTDDITAISAVISRTQYATPEGRTDGAQQIDAGSKQILDVLRENLEQLRTSDKQKFKTFQADGRDDIASARPSSLSPVAAAWRAGMIRQVELLLLSNGDDSLPAVQPPAIAVRMMPITQPRALGDEDKTWWIGQAEEAAKSISLDVFYEWKITIPKNAGEVILTVHERWKQVVAESWTAVAKDPNAYFPIVSHDEAWARLRLIASARHVLAGVIRVWAQDKLELQAKLKDPKQQGRRDVVLTLHAPYSEYTKEKSATNNNRYENAAAVTVALDRQGQKHTVILNNDARGDSLYAELADHLASAATAAIKVADILDGTDASLAYTGAKGDLGTFTLFTNLFEIGPGSGRSARLCDSVVQLSDAAQTTDMKQLSKIEIEGPRPSKAIIESNPVQFVDATLTANGGDSGAVMRAISGLDLNAETRSKIDRRLKQLSEPSRRSSPAGIAEPETIGH
jgi:hypothetical protein